ncbi:hypothetical protein B0J17DRAFT_581129, partial [Rhizoctonia solani]
PDSKAQVANAIREACIYVGFFLRENHGINEAVIRSVLDTTRQFFFILQTSQLIIWSLSAILMCVYPSLTSVKPPISRVVIPFLRKYIHEYFEIGPEIDVSPDIAMSGLNIWPPEDVIPGFQEATLRYGYPRSYRAWLETFTVFALALNLPEGFFANKVKTTAASMRIIHYPPQAAVVEKQGTGIGAHTEHIWTSILSMLQTNPTSLTVLNTSSQWIDAKPIPGTLIINIGDQLSIWTNDIFKSTVHRVINGSGTYSIPLFFCADYDVKLEALPSCVSESRPALYEPILAGDHVNQGWRNCMRT